MTPHLTHEELCNILLARSPHPLSSDYAAIQNHLSLCPACASELEDLRASVGLLRDATTSYTQQRFSRLSPQTISAISSPKPSPFDPPSLHPHHHLHSHQHLPPQPAAFSTSSRHTL